MFNYNQTLKTAFVVSLLLLFSQKKCVAQQYKELHKSNSRPNIVYIFADDLGYNEIGAYGQQKIETPNIDALVSHGMKFTQHYAFPVCAPSRNVLLTGKNSGHIYIRGNDGWTERGDVWDFEKMEANPALEGQLPIPDSTLTIAELLKKANYRTGLVGKWGLGGPMTEGLPNKQGFDFFYGYLCQREAHQYYPGHLWKNDARVPLNNKLQTPSQKLSGDLDPRDPRSYLKYSQQDYAPKLMLNEALGFIESNKGKPFFLEYAPPLPHVSLQAPKRWIQYYHKKFGDEKPYTGDEGYLPARYPHATYAAMVSYLDEQIGKIIKKLKLTGEYENTLIMFASDNGPTYNGGTDSPWFDSGGPFKSARGWGKGFLHEGGIRVPMIASWKGKIKSRSTTDLISATWDVLPTLCEVAGITPPMDIDGISFLPTLLGNETQQKKHDFLYWEFPAYGGQQAVRMGKWKGIRKNIIKKENMDIALYNLETDIQEQHNVADEYPDIVKKIKQVMRKEHTTPAVHAFRMEALE